MFLKGLSEAKCLVLRSVPWNRPNSAELCTVEEGANLSGNEQHFIIDTSPPNIDLYEAFNYATRTICFNRECFSSC